MALSWTQISNSNTHSLAITNLGLMFCWGSNTDGALGLNLATSALRSEATQVGTSSWTQVATANRFSLAIRTDGTLWAWGRNNNGQLGQNNRTHRSSPVQVGSESWIQVVATDTNSVAAIKSDGTLWTWGLNTNRELGHGDNTTRSSPSQIGTDTWSKIVCSSDGSGIARFLAIKSDGTLWGWGSNAGFGLGDGVKIHADEYDVGQYNSAFINYDKYLWSAGDNEYSQLGFNPLQNQSDWIDYELTKGNSFFIDSNNNLYGFGFNTYGQLGQNDRIHRSQPVLIATNAKKLARMHFYDTDGDDGYGYLGYIGTDDRLYTCGWQQLTQNHSWIQISGSSRERLYGIRSDKTLWFWGRSEVGESGTGNQQEETTNTGVPLQIPGSWNYVTSGFYNNTFAIKTDNTLWAWGSNEYGELAQNNTVHRSSPVQIAGAWSKISAGWAVHGIKTDGTLWGWADGTNGAVGDGTETIRSSPIQIGALTGWTAVADSSNGLAFAIRNNRSLFAWGINSDGQLGLNNRTDRSSPVQVGTDANSWILVSAGWRNAGAIRSDGTLWMWGTGENGSNGDNTTINRSSPVQISGGGSWQALNVGNYYESDGLIEVSPGVFEEDEGGTYPKAFKSDGTIWSWGANHTGRLGLNDTVHRSSPVQIESFVLNNGLSNVNVISDNATEFTANDSIYVIGEEGRNYSVSPNVIYVRPRSRPVIVDALRDPRDVTDPLVYFRQFIWNDTYNYSYVHRSSPVVLGFHQKFKDVSMENGYVFGGDPYTLAIQTDGTLWGWGENGYGRLGLNTTVHRLGGPTPINSDKDWIQVDVGRRTSGALKANTLYTWGENINGQLGIGILNHRSTPVLVSSGLAATYDVDFFSNSGQHFAAIMEGRLATWGNNSNGQLGLGDKIHRFSPVQVTAPDVDVSWTTVRASQTKTIGVIDNRLYAWGGGYALDTFPYDNIDLNYIRRSTPVVITGFLSKSELRSSHIGPATFTLYNRYNRDILKVTGEGYNNYGYLLSKTNSANTSSLSTGNTIFAWGFNFRSAHGIVANSTPSIWDGDDYLEERIIFSPTVVVEEGDTTLAVSNPVQIGANTWAKISTSKQNQFTLAIAEDGTLWGWGVNHQGQLGLNNTDLITEPQQISSESWSLIKAGFDQSYAIKSDGTLWSWGYNAMGQLGNGDKLARSSPVQVGTSSWTQVAVSEWGTFALGIRDDNRLYAWGQNTHGQLGLNFRFHRSSPVVVGTRSWKAVSAGEEHSVGIRSDDNNIYAWGRNTNGQLGIGSFFHRSSPVLITSLVPGSWDQISSGSIHNFAIRSDGTLWGWGRNLNDCLNIDGVSAYITRPTQVKESFETDDLAKYAIASAGEFNSIVKRGNNGLWNDNLLLSFGINNFGELALNQVGSTENFADSSSLDNTIRDYLSDTSTRSSPVLISSRTWSEITSGSSHSAGVTTDVRRRPYIWGSNQDGQLTNLSVDKPYRPANVAVGSSATLPTEFANERWRSFSAGNNYTMMIKQKTGLLYGTGLNDQGQLGDGTTENRSSPTQVDSNSRFVSVQAGDKKTLGIRF